MPQTARRKMSAIDIPHDRLVVTSTSEVLLEYPEGQLPLRSNIPWQDSIRRLHKEFSADNLDACQYLLDSPMAKTTAEIKRYAAPSFREQRPVVDIVLDLMSRIHQFMGKEFLKIVVILLVNISLLFLCMVKDGLLIMLKDVWVM